MLSASQYWKEDLVKLAGKIERRLVQRRWGSRSIFALEKELFFGFYIVRKLIELRRVPRETSEKTFSILEIPLENAPSIFDQNPDLSKIIIGSGERVNLKLQAICNQFVHSQRLYPLIFSEIFFGVLVCSDFKYKSGIYLITTFDVVEIYRHVGKSDPEPNGKTMDESHRL